MNPQGQGPAGQPTHQTLPTPTPAAVLHTETTPARSQAHEHRDTPPHRSSPASAGKLPDAPEALRLVRENLQLQSQQIQQLATMMQRDREETADLMEETRATMQLMQQMLAQWAEQVEKLGLAVGALVKLEMAIEAREARQAQQQQL